MPKSPNNYSLISLLSVLSKVLEKHLYYLITDHLEEGHLLSDSQWGFRSSRSTTSALLSTFSSWLSSLDSGIDICAVFFDYQKALDTVPHRPLLDKLSSIAPNSHLVSWVANYLTSRNQRVVIDGAASRTSPVLPGVNQGSVLGPLPFLIDVNDVTSIPTSPDTKNSLFAHDFLLY